MKHSWADIEELSRVDKGRQAVGAYEPKKNLDVGPGSAPLGTRVVTERGPGIQEHAAGGPTRCPDAALKN